MGKHVYKPTGRPRGRPTIAETPSSLRLTTAFTPDQRATVRHVAHDMGLSVGAVIRTAINVFVADSGDPPIFRRIR